MWVFKTVDFHIYDKNLYTKMQIDIYFLEVTYVDANNCWIHFIGVTLIWLYKTAIVKKTTQKCQFYHLTK
jgi:hypothetical protein